MLKFPRVVWVAVREHKAALALVSSWRSRRAGGRLVTIRLIFTFNFTSFGQTGKSIKTTIEKWYQSQVDAVHGKTSNRHHRTPVQSTYFLSRRHSERKLIVICCKRGLGTVKSSFAPVTSVFGYFVGRVAKWKCNFSCELVGESESCVVSQCVQLKSQSTRVWISLHSSKWNRKWFVEPWAWRSTFRILVSLAGHLRLRSPRRILIYSKHQVSLTVNLTDEQYSKIGGNFCVSCWLGDESRITHTFSCRHHVLPTLIANTRALIPLCFCLFSESSHVHQLL